MPRNDETESPAQFRRSQRVDIQRSIWSFISLTSTLCYSEFLPRNYFPGSVRDMSGFPWGAANGPRQHLPKTTSRTRFDRISGTVRKRCSPFFRRYQTIRYGPCFARGMGSTRSQAPGRPQWAVDRENRARRGARFHYVGSAG